MKLKELSNMLHIFICEMEYTLKDKDKRNRAYAPQVFWKNKYTLETIETALTQAEKEHKALEIFKNKQIELKLLKYSTCLEEYNTNLYGVYEDEFAKKYALTKEEYDLLNEMLGHDFSKEK